MVDLLQTFVAPVLLLAGCFFCFAGGVGILRFPEFFTRMHAAGVSDTLGAGLVLVALMLFSMSFAEVIKLALIMAFILITSPTSSHALAKVAVRAGVLPVVTPEVVTEVPPEVPSEVPSEVPIETAMDKKARGDEGGDASKST